VFVSDTEGVSRGAQGRRFYAPAPGDTAAAHFRVRVTGLPETIIVTYPEQLLRPW